jgi:hypothetical protein
VSGTLKMADELLAKIYQVPRAEIAPQTPSAKKKLKIKTWSSNW